jgi:hypothetical protein
VLFKRLKMPVTCQRKILWTSKVLDSLKIRELETVLRWHRARFRAYWRCQFFREMGVANLSETQSRTIGDAVRPRLARAL